MQEKLESCLSPFTKINSKYIKNLNLRYETLLWRYKRKVRGTFQEIGTESYFLIRTPKHWEQKQKVAHGH
jgi:hypothetical protein